MRIEEIKWKDGRGLEDFVLWGINPIKTLVCYLQNDLEMDFAGISDENSKDRMIILNYLIEDLTEKAEECIRKFLVELDELDKGIDGTGLIKPRENPSYMKDEDHFAAFLKTCCCIDKDYADTEETELYGVFYIWYQDNVLCDVPSKEWFADTMSKRFKRIKGESGRYFYDGLMLKE